MDELCKRAAEDFIRSHYAIALTGAGISTESGIPDFRGPSGVWTKDPRAERKAYQSYTTFLQNPKVYWEERLNEPSLLGDLERAMPNPSHYALAELEGLGILKCLITQNVDGLHGRAGTRNLIEYHGSYSKLRCSQCGTRFPREEIDLDGLRREDRLPPLCSCGGVIKVDTVHFTEPIPQDVAKNSDEAARTCDLMLICGTSAAVFPFAQLPRIARHRRAVTIIEVNSDPTPLTEEGISDYLIRGKTGDVLPRIVEEVKRIQGQS